VKAFKVLPFSLLLALPASAELVDRVAAVVNNDVITLSEVETRIGPELAHLRSQIEPAKWGEARGELVKKAVDLLVGEKLMEGQVKELNIEVSETEMDSAIDDVKRQNNIDSSAFEAALAQEGYTLAGYRAFLKKQLSRMKLVNLKVRSKIKVSDEDLKAEYARVAHDEQLDVEVHCRHILVQVAPTATPEQIEAARLKAVKLQEEASKPGVDFAELARKKSEGPSAADGGDLGFFRRGVMEAKFEKAAFTLPTGGVSEPIRTKFGWHVLKVEDKRSVAPQPFDEVKDQLREKLLKGQQEKYIEQYVQELRANAVVENKLSADESK
jgi:peptidyl-prolyl cis-trans isomerase SurA